MLHEFIFFVAIGKGFPRWKHYKFDRSLRMVYYGGTLSPIEKLVKGNGMVQDGTGWYRMAGKK